MAKTSQPTGRPAASPPFLPRTVILAVVAVLSFFVARLGTLSVVPEVGGSIVWPLSGLALGILVLSPRHDWPMTLAAIYVPTLAADLVAGFAWRASVAFTLVDATETTLAAWLLVRLLGTPIRLTRLREVVALVAVAAILSNGVTSLMGAAVVTVAFGLPFWKTWLAWWLASGAGMLLVAPLILGWSWAAAELKRLRLQSLAEALVLLAALGLLAVWIFRTDPRTATFLLPLPYIAYPFLFWAAVRFGPFGAAAASLVLSAVALLYTLHGTGPFALTARSTTEQVLALQAFLNVAILAALVPAAVISERRRAEDETARAHRRFRTIFENAGDAILLIDADSIIDCNPRAEALYGLPREALLQRKPGELSPPTQPDGRLSREVAVECVQAALSGAPQYYEWTHHGRRPARRGDDARTPGRAARRLRDTGRE